MVAREWKFQLSDAQYEKLESWRNELLKNKWNKRKADKNYGAIGGEVTFVITPTSLGELVTAFYCKKTNRPIGNIRTNDILLI